MVLIESSLFLVNLAESLFECFADYLVLDANDCFDDGCPTRVDPLETFGQFFLGPPFEQLLVKQEHLFARMFVLLLQTSLVGPIFDAAFILALDPIRILFTRTGQILFQRLLVTAPILVELCLCLLQILLNRFRFDPPQHTSLHEVGFFVARQLGYQCPKATSIQLVLLLA